MKRLRLIEPPGSELPIKKLPPVPGPVVRPPQAWGIAWMFAFIVVSWAMAALAAHFGMFPTEADYSVP